MRSAVLTGTVGVRLQLQNTEDKLKGMTQICTERSKLMDAMSKAQPNSGFVNNWERRMAMQTDNF